MAGPSGTSRSDAVKCSADDNPLPSPVRGQAMDCPDIEIRLTKVTDSEAASGNRSSRATTMKTWT